MERLSRSVDSRGWIVGLLVLGGIIGWFLMSQKPHDSTRIADPGVGPPVVEAPQSQADSSARHAASPVAATTGSPNCVDQYLDIASGPQQQRSCVSRTRVIQNGNVRTYRVESQGGAVSSALVDAAGERVLRAQLTLDSGAPFACGAGRCPGISFGPYDSQGARSIRFEKARLSRAAAKVEEEDAVLVTGQLRTIPDDQLSSSTCSGQVLLVSRGPGTLHFCPDSGAGYDLDEDGGTTFRFTNHDGTTLAVAVNAAGALKSVALGSHECRAPGCGGVTIGPADAEGSRRFSFSGTPLLERGSDSNSAVLNGVVVLPPL